MRSWLALLVAPLFGLWLVISEPWQIAPNTIRWTTQSEQDVFGYDIYRGDQQDGPFERINTQTILGVGTTDLPQSYQFSDAEIDAETVYWYYVETVALTGERKPLTPVYPSPPKSASLW
ncbi:MAG: hypothetical protein AAGI11_00510 [Pseudomonadota bacterium]